MKRPVGSIESASPRPWRVEYVTKQKTAYVRAANGEVVAICHADNAELMVKAVNESAFDAVIADRNCLAELNRACCDENERLRELLDRLLAVAHNRMPAQPTIEELEVLTAAEREVAK